MAYNFNLDGVLAHRSIRITTLLAFASILELFPQIADADAWAYSAADVNTTWFDAGPDITVTVSSSGYSNLLGPGAYGSYNNTPLLSASLHDNFASVLSTTSGFALTSWEVGEGTIYFLTDSSSTPESITFYSTGTAIGNTGVSSPSDLATYNSFAGLALEEGPNTSYVDYIDFAGTNTGYGSSHFAVEDTVTVVPGVETFFESVSYGETVVHSYDSNAVTPSPLAALPFCAGLAAYARRRRTSTL